MDTPGAADAVAAADTVNAASAAKARALHLQRAAIFLDKLQDVGAALALARSLAQRDPYAAEEIYLKCLETSPGDAEVLWALSSLARDRGDYLRAAKFIKDAASRTQNPLELGRLYAEAGSLHLDRLADESTGSGPLRAGASRRSRAEHCGAPAPLPARESSRLDTCRTPHRSAGAQDAG